MTPDRFPASQTLRSLLLAVAAAFALPASSADSAGDRERPPRIDYLFPAGGQTGRTVEVTVGGKGLDATAGVRVTGDGVRGEVLRVDRGTTATIAVTIAPDATPGQRDLRLITPAGASSRARFVVSSLPELTEQEPNSTRNAAQPLRTLPLVVNGQIELTGRDFYRFQAGAGQTIVCQVQAQQLHPCLADSVPGCCRAVLSLYDASGRRLASVDNPQSHPDPVLIYRFRRRGQYFLEIRDSLLRGREDFVYRLSIGELPYLTHIYPLGENCRSEASVSLFGINLSETAVTLPAAPGCPSIQWVRPGEGALACNTLPFARGPLAEVQELEPNDTLDRPEMIDVPATVNGRIEDPSDVDHYALFAEAGRQLVLEIRARRLDSPLDSVLTLFTADGDFIAQNNDCEDESMPHLMHHADSRLMHTFQTPGKYILKVADARGNGGEPYAYRLSISPPRPDFRLRVTPDNPCVGRGAATELRVTAVRRDAFEGPIELSIVDLPEGFTAAGTTIPARESKAVVILTAPGDASLGIHAPSILGTATISGQNVTRRAQPMECVTRAFFYRHLLPTEELVLTVTERITDHEDRRARRLHAQSR